jgi:endonuclease YncB( thermonuclease family)
MRYSIIPNQTKTAVVKAVHDGDSIKVQFEDGEVSWIRLYGCDAPEVISNHVTKDQPHGRESGNELRKLIKGQTVEVETLFRDQYGRMICKVNLLKEELGSDLQKIDLTKLLISEGLAWWLEEPKMDSTVKTELKSLHEYAKGKMLGLWSRQGRKLRPSTWRSRNRRFTMEKEFEDLW